MSDGYNASFASCAIVAASLIIFSCGRTAGADDADNHKGLPSFSPAVVMCEADLSRDEMRNSRCEMPKKTQGWGGGGWKGI